MGFLALLSIFVSMGPRSLSRYNFNVNVIIGICQTDMSYTTFLNQETVLIVIIPFTPQNNKVSAV
jgi:hypothetical protein